MGLLAGSSAPPTLSSRSSTLEAGSGIPEMKATSGELLPSSQEKQGTDNGMMARAWRKINERVSLEAHGVAPLALEQRTDAHFLQNFTLWLTMNATIACFSTGTLGPLLYGLSFRDSMLIILLFNIFSCGVPSSFAIFGPRLGVRTMTVARYSYGYYGAILPALLNLITFIGFCAVNAIVGGQVLSAVNPARISLTIGIVLIAIISMFVGFCGYRVLHTMEKWAWIPVIGAFVLLTAFGGRHLGAAMDYQPGVATAGNVLSFASIVVGFSISWSGCSADFNTYMHPSIPSYKIFFYTFAGLYLPSMLMQLLGAAFASAALSGTVTTWETAFTDGSIGGLMDVALEPLRGFGKVVLVVLALGMITNNAPTTYAFSLSLQIVFPFLTALPRFLFPIVATAIYLPIAIVGATHFDAALSNFLGLLGYWAAIFAAIIIVEHLVYRRGKFSSYDISIWNQSSRLPPGIAALFSSFCGAGIVVVSMDQVWWRGPIAKAITGPTVPYGGDVGFELGMAVGGITYLFTRFIERRVFGR